MYYYQKHIGDYRSATAHLDLLHHGVYQFLMETCYMNEAPLPADLEKVCRLCGARIPEEKQAVANILEEFFELTEHGYVNHRILLEIEKYHATSEKNRVNGGKGGRPRKKPQETPNNPVGFDSVNAGLENDANPEPNQKATINHEPVTNIIDSSSNAPKTNFALVPIKFSQYQPMDHKRYSILECINQYPLQQDFIDCGIERFADVDYQDLISMFTNFGDFYSAKGESSKNTPSLWLVKWFTWIQNNKDDARRKREDKHTSKKQKNYSSAAARTSSEVNSWMDEINTDDSAPLIRDVHEVEGVKYA